MQTKTQANKWKTNEQKKEWKRKKEQRQTWINNENDYHKKRWQMSNKEQTKGKLLNKQMNGQIWMNMQITEQWINEQTKNISTTEILHLLYYLYTHIQSYCESENKDSFCIMFCFT